MADSVSLHSFPSNDVEALAFLYVQHKSTPLDSPEALYGLYLDAYYKIRAEHAKRRDWITKMDKETR